MTPCRWSGWPGAWCLDCGRADPMEVCLADHAVWVEDDPSVDHDDDDSMRGHFECPDGTHANAACTEPWSKRHDPYASVGAVPPSSVGLKSWRPDVAVKWGKWTFGFWVDRANKTAFGIDLGPLEIVWRYEGYRP